MEEKKESDVKKISRWIDGEREEWKVIVCVCVCDRESESEREVANNVGWHRREMATWHSACCRNDLLYSCLEFASLF